MAPQTPIPPSFQVERVSIASDGTEANGPSGGFGSWGPAISANGRYVTYNSDASNLVPGDTNEASDIFVFDRQTRATERVSVASDGTEANGGSGFDYDISADGRYVAYWSDASNLVPADTNGFADVFVFDRQTSTTERVSIASSGTEANQTSFFPAISDDGRYVTFESIASNLIPGDTNGAVDVFVFDRETNTTERISVASNGTQGDHHSRSPAISADGRYVTFESEATNLVPGDTNEANDVFVFDRETHTTTRVSVASDGTQANSFSWFEPAISGDGRYVTFESLATNLVPGDTNEANDVFVFDRETHTTTRVSVASDGTEGNGPAGSGIPAISANGRYVTYVGASTNLIPGDTNDTADVFVFDRETHTTTRVSIASDGAQSNGFSSLPDISADGRSMVYVSEATNLVPGDTNGTQDVFVVQMEVAPPVDGVVKDGDGGNNVLKGTRRDDILRGHGGNDWLFGLEGDDRLECDEGNDKAFGGKGDDTVLGGVGSDRIWTGTGSDLVVFNEGDGYDWVFDFDQRRHEDDHSFDRVQLDVSIGTNAIDDFAELEASIASGEISLSTRNCSLTLTFDNGDALTLRGVRELSADDWLFI
jgi:archaellum component FlaF (FlaF/FlaG flagellin family)